MEQGGVTGPAARPLSRARPLRAALAVLALASLAAAKPAAPPDQSRLTLERIFASSELEPTTVAPFRWVGSDQYVTVEGPPTAPTVVAYDLAANRRDVLLSHDQLQTPSRPDAAEIEDVHVSSNRRFVLLYTNAKPVWREKTRGDYWLFDRRAATLRRLGGSAPPASLMFAKFAPDGRRVAYVRDRDLYVEDTMSAVVKRLTTAESKEIVNGTFDWVNEEEFGLRDGFRWSPDGAAIAFWQIDTREVRTFPLINNTDEPYARVVSIPYPIAGTTNSAVRVGVIDVNSGKIRWMRLPGSPRDSYIVWLDWTSDASGLLLQRINRRQDRNELFLVRRGTGEASVVLTERDAAWVEKVDDVRWLATRNELLWLSERNGWRQAFVVSADGRSTRPITPPNEDTEQVVGVDEQAAWIFYIASPQNPTQRFLYRAKLDGSAERERVTPASERGWHTYQVSPSGRWALHSRSSFGVAPVSELVDLPAHRPVRRLVDNAAVVGRLDALQESSVEFFRIDIGGGVALDAWMMKPTGFDPTRRYPLLMYVYGEPAAQTVVDRWGGKRYLWHRMLTQEGYLVASVDNRGTPAPRGREWRKIVHRQVGVLAPEEQAAAVRALVLRPYVDASRIGTWGWSSGGSMSLHAIFRFPELYRTALAVAPLTDQRLYDTIYQERYMGLPEENRVGYERGSPITYVDGLRGRLLLIHGSGDDNVHVQSTERLVNALIERGKPLSVMLYPNRRHTISEGRNTLFHVYQTLTDFLHQHLPAGSMDLAGPSRR